MKNKNYTCGKKCTCCEAEKLTITCGSSEESKQYEYKIDSKLQHAEHEHHGSKTHEKSHHDHEAATADPMMAKAIEANMKLRFLWSLLLTIPIVLYSDLGQNIFGLQLWSPIPTNWLLFILTTPIVFWAGSIFITGAYYSLKSKKLNMSVLIATGVLAAYTFSTITLITGQKESFFDAAAMLVTFVLFGHWMEMKSRRGTSDALRALFNLVPPMASVLRHSKEIKIATSELQIGDIVILKPGDKVPVDGKIITGQTTIDESLVTGESMPITKAVDDQVIGGSLNKTGSIQFKVTQAGNETVLANIIKLVEDAQNSKAPSQRLADKAAGYLVILAIGSGIITFFSWSILANASLMTSLTFAISAVVIACPDALGLATPTAVAVGTGIGARHNILIKDATTLEQTSKIQQIVLDKTGTLTEGKPTIDDIVTTENIPLKEFLYLATSAQKLSNHPFSQAMVNKAKKEHIALSSDVKDFSAIEGHGVQAIVDNKKVLVGTQRFFEKNGIDTSYFERKAQELMRQGKSLSFVSIDGAIAGIITISDNLRESSKETIEGLKKLGIQTTLLTGDHQIIAQAIASELGIDRVFSQVLPADKALYIKKLQEEGFFVAMVGDGINDAPALAQADIGIAIGAGTDVAIEAADIVLMKSNPADILNAIILSKATLKKMKENLFWAAIYNLLAIPIAAGLFYKPFGWYLAPEISALLMSLSSIIVALNAISLKRVSSRLKR